MQMESIVFLQNKIRILLVYDKYSISFAAAIQVKPNLGFEAIKRRL